MLEREQETEPGDVQPPAELIDYGRWCADQGLRPYGDADDPASMQAAVDQWNVWMQLRREWADSHDLDEDDDMDLVGGQPWDASAI